MKKYFDEVLIDKAVKHCQSVWPDEGCGFIVKDDFLPMENVSNEKILAFEIDPHEYIKYAKDIKCIIHSHDNFPHASKKDMLQQIASNIPWGIVFLINKAVEQVAFFGDQIEPQDLIGRPFVHGIYDCYSLLRDYYRTKGRTIPIFPRDNLWWERNPSMLLDGFIEAGFEEIDTSEIREGDVFFAQVCANVVNHSGIILKDGIILHHLYGRLSRREPIYSWKKFISGYYRYNGGKNA